MAIAVSMSEESAGLASRFQPHASSSTHSVSRRTVTQGGALQEGLFLQAAGIGHHQGR